MRPQGFARLHPLPPEDVCEAVRRLPSTGVGPLFDFPTGELPARALRYVLLRARSCCMDLPMNGTNIIERAYQLALESGSVEEIKKKLLREGYVNVHAHLGGRQIRHDLLERLGRPGSSAGNPS